MGQARRGALPRFADAHLPIGEHSGERCARIPTKVASACASADSGFAGCAGLVGAPGRPGLLENTLRFLRSQWPDLRAAGTSSVDLAVKLRSARNTDGYETVWFYQRLSIACARHGWKTTANSDTARTTDWRPTAAE